MQKSDRSGKKKPMRGWTLSASTLGLLTVIHFTKLLDSVSTLPGNVRANYKL